MSLQFIMGPSGAGKSHYLYECITKEALEHPEKNYIFLVPDQFKMEAERELVLANPRKGLLNVEVLSFNRLAHRVFEETGENKRMILDDVGKNFIIRKLAGDNEDQLKILGKNLKKPGYISEIKSIISEFTQYDVKQEALLAAIEQEKQNPKLCYKLQDMEVIYKEFKAYLENRYITGEEIMDVLALVAEKSAMLKDCVLVLDGFTGFTPVQNKLLRELLKICEKVLVSVTITKDENPYVYRHPYQLFALSKQMVTTLIQLAKEEKVEILDAVSLFDEPSYRFRENEPLAFLETHLFRYSKNCYEKEQDCIQIWRGGNAEEEVQFVAQEIRRLIRAKGYRYRDIAVLTNGLDTYIGAVERIFSQYDIPYFMDHKRSILLNAFVEYFRGLLAMAEQNFSYESVFRYLRTGLTGLSVDEIDVLENYVVALGIRGWKRWQEKWLRKTKSMNEEELCEVNRIREQFLKSIEEIMATLKGRKKTVLEYTQALHTFFLKEELQKHVKEYQIRFEEMGEFAFAKEYAQVYRMVIEVFDQFVELLGQETISLKEYCELLDAGLQESKIGIIPPSVDQIVIGDVQRSRINHVKVVFLIGASDDHLPGNVRTGGLLSEYDRARLTETGAILAPGIKEKTYIQKFYLYLGLTKPTDKVYLVYSKSNEKGEATRPSYLVNELLRMFAKLRVQEVSHRMQEMELTPDSAVACVIEGLQKHEEGLEQAWKELYSWYKRHPEYASKLAEIIEAFFYEKPESRLTKEAAKCLYGEILSNSVSRLEAFSKCAYLHFLQYGLQLKSREEYQIGALDLGNIFHSSIEKFSQKLEKEGYTWKKIPEDVEERLIHESVEECIVDYGNSVLYSSARNEYVIVRVKRMLRRTVWAIKRQLEKGDFMPVGYEISFNSYTGIPSAHVNLGELGEMHLRGKIDRVDVCEENDKIYVKVTDYKSSHHNLELDQLYYGLQLQLIVYMNAAMEMQQKEHPDKEVLPAGVLYYQVQDPMLESTSEDEDLENKILKSMRPTGMVHASSEVVSHMDREFTRDSLVIPVTRKNDGNWDARSKVLTEEEFRVLLAYTKEQVKKIGMEILNGEADIRPAELGGKTNCSICEYKAICNFDEKVKGFEYRSLEKLDRDTVMEKMRQEVETWK